MKAWITKYALTEGIIEVADAETCDNVNPDMLKWSAHGYSHGEGRDWHRTLESAQKRAEVMRVRRIASIEKQAAALRIKTIPVVQK